MTRILVAERKLSKIEKLQDERSIQYFLLKNDHDKYKILILEQTETDNKEIKIDKLFDDKQLALNLINILYENSITPEQSNDVINDLLENEEKNNMTSILVAERKLHKIENLQDERLIQYFLLKNDSDKYKILISDQVGLNNKKTEIDKLFDNKELALNLINILCENSISPEQSNDIIHDLDKTSIN